MRDAHNDPSEQRALRADATPGSHPRHQEIARIAVPAVLEGLVAVVITTIDTKMVSVLGKGAISAISFTAQPKLIFFAIFYALGTALSMFVAQALGRRDRDEANEYLHTILKLTLVLSVVLGVVLVALTGPIMALCNRQADTVGMSETFFRIIMGFMVFQTVSIVLNAGLRGVGKTKVTLVSNIVMGVVDIVFNYLLIEGHLGFPRLEVAGDAIATVLGTAAACAVSAFVLVRRADFLSLKGFFAHRIMHNREMLRTIVFKAGNIVFENLFTRVGFLLSSIVVSTLSSDKTAVYSVAMILLNYSFAFGDGLQSAVVTLCGRSMGANRYDDLRQYLRESLRMGMVTSAVLSIAYVVGSRWFFGLYFQDEASLTMGLYSSVFASALTFLQILRIISVGALRGMGEVLTPRRIATVCVLILNPAASYLLGIVLDFGVWGIWVASLLTQTAWFTMCMFATRSHLK